MAHVQNPYRDGSPINPRPEPRESAIEKYTRHTRNAAVTILVISIIGIILALIGAIYQVVSYSNLQNAINQSTSISSGL